DHRPGDRRGPRRAAVDRDPAPPARAGVTAPMTPPHLYLFDIDGTLVNVGGAGREALAVALQETYGTTGAIDHYDFRGRTDPRIVLDLLGGAGWAEADIHARLPGCFAAYLRELQALLADGRRVRTLPGVADVVRTLGAREDAVVGLLTGN